MNYSFSALIIDVAMVTVLVASIFSFLRKGFLAGTVTLVGKIGGLFVAWLVSSKLAPAVFSGFFQARMTAQTTQTVQSGGTQGIDNVLNNLSGIVPPSFIEKIQSSVHNALDSSSGNIAQNIVDNIIMPLMVPVISIILFFITYAICRLLIAFMVAALTQVNKVPLVGTVNRLAGAGVGFIAGSLNIFICMVAIWSVLIITSDSLSFFNHQTLQGSVFYMLFAKYNPFF